MSYAYTDEAIGDDNNRGSFITIASNYYNKSNYDNGKLQMSVSFTAHETNTLYLHTNLQNVAGTYLIDNLTVAEPRFEERAIPTRLLLCLGGQIDNLRVIGPASGQVAVLQAFGKFRRFAIGQQVKDSLGNSSHNVPPYLRASLRPSSPRATPACHGAISARAAFSPCGVRLSSNVCHAVCVGREANRAHRLVGVAPRNNCKA